MQSKTLIAKVQVNLDNLNITGPGEKFERSNIERIPEFSSPSVSGLEIIATGSYNYILSVIAYKPDLYSSVSGTSL